MVGGGGGGGRGDAGGGVSAIALAMVLAAVVAVAAVAAKGGERFRTNARRKACTTPASNTHFPILQYALFSSSSASSTYQRSPESSVPAGAEGSYRPAQRLRCCR